MKEKGIIFLLFIVFLLTLVAGLVGFSYTKVIKDINTYYKLIGEDKVTIEYGQDYIEEGVCTKTPNIDFAEYVKIDSNLNKDKVGNYRILYDLTYKRYDKVLKREVEVIDTIQPIIKLVNCVKDQYVIVKSQIKNCEYEVYDNYDKDIDQRVQIDSNVNINKKGDYTVKYIVTDSSGNTDSKEVNIHVRNKFDLTYIKVYISKQKLEYYQNNKKVLQTPITSGRNNATKLGNFKIRNKVRNTFLKGKDYISYVQYWMAYDGNSFGIHDASWRSNFGSQSYKTNGSHGCINVPTKAVAKLYSMVEIGTPVYILK